MMADLKNQTHSCGASPRRTQKTRIGARVNLQNEPIEVILITMPLEPWSIDAIDSAKRTQFGPQL
jgi:hypothetical protein